MQTQSDAEKKALKSHITKVTLFQIIVENSSITQY